MTSLGRLFTKWWLNRLANGALIMKNYPRAIQRYRQILAVDPSDAYARSVLANVYAETGDPDSALREFKLLVEHHPEDA
jgi:tetratricopeptide (TPR) repeat protein